MSSTEKTVWPAIRTITVKLRHMPNVLIDAGVAVDTGKPVVYLWIDGGDRETLTPTEARRWAAGLVKAADCCDDKSAAVRKIRSRPLIKEESPRRSSKQSTKVRAARM